MNESVRGQATPFVFFFRENKTKEKLLQSRRVEKLWSLWYEGHECVLGALFLSQEEAGAVLHLIFMVVPSVTPGHQKTAQK